MSSHNETIRALFWLRWIAIAGQCLSFVVAEHTLSFPVSWQGLVPVLILTVLWNSYTGVLLAKKSVFETRGLSLQLLFDIAQLSVVLYLSGGAQNPFVSLLLLPIAMAVLSGNTLGTVIATIAAVIAYLGLMRFSPELHWHAAHDLQMNAHLFGMWVNFVVIALLLSGFGLRMLSALKRRENAIQQLREKNLQNEALVSLGTQAAHVAHQMGTPLNTMLLLAQELRSFVEDKDGQSAINDLEAQIGVCRKGLESLRDKMQPQEMPLSSAIAHAIEEWRWFRPEAQITQHHEHLSDENELTVAASFEPAFLNLLNNAYEASRRNHSQRIHVSVECHDTHWIISIDDEGRGFDRKLSEASNSQGLGIGITLANASIEKLGGEVQWLERKPIGTRTMIRLPLAPTNQR